MNILTSCAVITLMCGPATAQDFDTSNLNPTYPVIRMSRCYVEAKDGSLFVVNCGATAARDAAGNPMALPRGEWGTVQGLCQSRDVWQVCRDKPVYNTVPPTLRGDK